MEKAKGDPALQINCNGKGPLSAEWMTPKALCIQQNEPEIWEAAKTLCEYQDFLNLKLTGQVCLQRRDPMALERRRVHQGFQGSAGRPLSLYQKINLPELADKLPKKCLPMGALVGTLTRQAAVDLNLPEDLPVAQVSV